MASAQRKPLSSPDETRTFPKGKIDLFTLAGLTISHGVLEPGWKWSECVKPIVNTESCQAGHIGVCLVGRMHVRMDDGSEIDIGPRDVFSIPPGHDAWIVGDQNCVVLDISGAANYAKPA